MIAFTLNCIPTAQARARHGVVNGHSMTFKADSQRANERTLDALLAPHAPQTPMTGAIVLEFCAAFPPAKSASKKERAAMLRGLKPHTKKPDLDNLAKQLKDSMTRLQFWNDDKQVVEMRCSKIYAEYGRWDVVIQEKPEVQA